MERGPSLHDIQPTRRERAALVGLDTGSDEEGFNDRMGELALLADTAGAEVTARFTQKRPRPDPATYIGQGKAQEVGQAVRDLQLDAAVFANRLSPAQQRNLSEIIPGKVIDRTRLILDIFAQRAQTREGKLQVELAQLNYMLPRLVGMGEELSRLGGGIGTRGPGETKLETERRRIRDRMADLKRDIENVRSHREVLRRDRKRSRIPLFALVGYTNAGKSTLMNRLTGAGQLVEDQLFATLDPTVRRVDLSGEYEALVSDTVGFIQDLPHELVAAFRATLEEVTEADVLLHVIDASDPRREERIDAVNRVLDQLGAGGKPVIAVLNKIDRLAEPLPAGLLRRLPRPVSLSALSGLGLDQLQGAMVETLRRHRMDLDLVIPYTQMDLVSILHEQGVVHSEEFQKDGIHITAEVETVWARRIQARLSPGEE